MIDGSLGSKCAYVGSKQMDNLYTKIFIVLRCENILSCFRNTRYCTAQKTSFSLRVSYLNVTNPQFPADLVTFTEEKFNGKLHFYALFVSLNYKSKTYIGYRIRFTMQNSFHH